MAKITRDTHDDTKNYTKVVEQYGVPFVDNEQNEQQDVQTTNRVETLHSVYGGHRASQEGQTDNVVPVSAKGTDFSATGGTADITLSAGEVYVEGFRIVVPSAISLAGEPNITFEATASADTYGIIYADVVISEIDSSDDPNIANQNIGETTVREKISFNFRQSESGTSFAAAFSAITAGSPAAGDRIWKGNTARVLICRYYRANATSTINTSDIWSYRQPSPGELLGNIGPWVFTHKPYQDTTGVWQGIDARGSLSADGMIVWNSDDERLIIGHLDDQGVSAVPARAYRTGLSISFATNTYASSGYTSALVSSTRGVEGLVTGAGDVDGTAVLQETPTWTAGFNIPDGQALGYVSVAAAGSAYNNLPPHKANRAADLDELVDVAPLPATFSTSGVDPAAILLQELRVLDIEEFAKAGPHSFVLCANLGGDLAWWNGQLTRGVTGRNVCEELGTAPKPWDAVVTSEGASHFSNRDGVERAVNWLKHHVAGELGTARHLKIQIRRGLFNMTRLLHQWGLASEFTGQAEEGQFDLDNNGLTLVGEGPEFCQLECQSSVNASTTIPGLINIVGNKIELKGLSIEETNISATRLPRYVLYVEANTVVLENCHFYGPVYLKCNNIRIKNCRFFNLGGTAFANIIETAAGNPFVAQHLRAEPRLIATSLVSYHQPRWDIENCTFLVDADDGTHASMVLTGDVEPAIDLSVRVHHCTWRYEDSAGDADQPSIHIDMDRADVEIDRCRFMGANGVVKTGADKGVTAEPFNGDFSGSPIGYPGGAGNTNRICANAYISITDERKRRSTTSIHDNYFSMADVSARASGRYILWGALIVMPSGLSMGASGVIANVTFSNNTVQMGGPNWGAAPGGNSPAIWGVYFAPATPDITTITNLVFENIAIKNNTFLPSHYSSPTTAASTWRCIMNEAINSWPTGGTGYLTDRSVIIGVVLKNQTSGPEVGDGRCWMLGLSINGNKTVQGSSGTASGFPIYGGIPFADNNASYWWSTLMIVDQGHFPSTVVSQPAVSGSMQLGASARMYMVATRISDNVWFYTAQQGAAQTGSTAGGTTMIEPAPYNIILSGGGGGWTYSNNHHSGGAEGTGGCGCIYAYHTAGIHLTGNFFNSYHYSSGSVIHKDIASSNDLYVGANLATPWATATFSVNTDNDFVGAGNDNF